MSEIAVGSSHTADEVRKFPCKQCGAQLAFSPGQSSLLCPYCGHKEEIPVTPEAIQAAIQEYDLVATLQNLPRTQGWGTERRSLHCENCGATTTFAEGQVAGECAFCGSKKVVQAQSAANLIRPESVVPFKITRQQAQEMFRNWIGKLWFRPNDLKHAAQLGKVNGGYLPFWTFDALTSASWTAERGWHYWETETYRDSEGRTQTRQVRKTRWEWASGYRQDFFDDELVCASRGLPPKLIAGITPYDLRALVPYDPSYLAGFTAEEYQIDLEEGWKIGQASIEQKVYHLCAGDVGGDTHRNLNVNTAFSQMTFKHMLLPVWIAAYMYQNKSWRFLVNGQTGKTSGEAPLSWWKIAGAVLLVLLIVALFLWLKGGRG